MTSKNISIEERQRLLGEHNSKGNDDDEMYMEEEQTSPKAQIQAAVSLLSLI
jgi:hypothetical protein